MTDVIDNAYDNALRNAVPNEIYGADSANLHLIGAGLDNAAADRAEAAQSNADCREAWAAIFGEL